MQRYVLELNNSNSFRKTVKLFYKRFRSYDENHTTLWLMKIFHEISSGFFPRKTMMKFTNNWLMNKQTK